MAWKKGPLPPDTHNWGAVVPVGEEGFYFADFLGDHVETTCPNYRVLQPDEIAWYNNSIESPPSAKGKAAM